MCPASYGPTGQEQASEPRGRSTGGNQAELDELLGLAIDVARRAGTLVADGRRRAGDPVGRAAAGLGVDTKSTPTDVVTELDRASERFLTEYLLRHRPHDAILGEEGGARDGRSGVRWLIDPIDGTVNFLYGLPAYAVSVAAERDGVTVVGAVHNPASGETFHAALGRGAWLGERRLDGPSTATLDQALVGTGFAYDARTRAEQAEVVARLLPRVRDIRRLGAASLDLCYAAAGRLDAYYERGLSPWDFAAGALVAQEAGLAVHGLRGRPAGPVFVLAAGTPIVDELACVLEELGADGAPPTGPQNS